MGIFLETDLEKLVYIMMWRGRESFRWRDWPDNDPLRVITGNLRQRSTQLSPYLALYWQHGSAISAQRKLSLSSLLIYFSNCQSHLMGEILKSLIFTLTEPRPTALPTGCPREFSHIPNSRRLYLFLFDTLKHQDDSGLSVQSNTEHVVFTISMFSWW